jgi:hypothetical protein
MEERNDVGRKGWIKSWEVIFNKKKQLTPHLGI